MVLPDHENALTSAADSQNTLTAKAWSPHNTFPLPDIPLVVIEPHQSGLGLDLRELWLHRELLYFLVWRDVKVRYKQTALGAAWAILQPLFMMLIFTLFFGRLAGINTGIDVPYPLFVFAGLAPWTFFVNAVTTSGNSVVASANLVTKVYFPRMLVPLASVLAALVDFALVFVVLSVMMLYYGVAPGHSVAALPVLAALTFMFALGVGMWVAALNVKYRDVRFALPFMLQLWLFASAVIVPSSVLPERWRWVVTLNPVSSIIEGYRAALFNQPFNWRGLATATVITLAVLAYAVHAFRRSERNFADII